MRISDWSSYVCSSDLNSRRIFARDGGRWGIGQFHRILIRRTYMGEHEFNKRSKTKELKPVSEIVMVPVPPIIDRETFDAVQKLLKARNPKVMPARVISGPTLLTGLIHCARSEEHTSELQSLMRIQYAVFCLKKKKSTQRA